MTDLNTQADNKRATLIGFSVAGSLITILFFAFINYSTGVRFPWFIFPSYAVLWWPMATIFAGRHSAKVLSLVGSAATIALFVFTNYVTSWSYPWFLYPSFAIVWWPLAAFFGARHGKILAIAGCIVMIAFFMVTNYVTSPAVIWFYYPVFAIIWWPLSVLLTGPRTVKVYSVLGALLILTFLAAVNIINSPFCPWALFAVFPVLMWPVSVLLGKRTVNKWAALLLSAVGIAYYVVLNMTVFPGFPWAIFPIYAILWWPVSSVLAKRGHLMLFSVCGTLLSTALFITLNYITTPWNIWAVYPIFALLWWPLATYYFIYRRRKSALQ
jgi:hypothetical protein